ncbi:hypothetical protein Daesc_003872 [Daldinia eschscholtzii]|uniref:Rhodopsin domain-containing protein n=1 Tax=Daldinia eschscholtzii TaxID=292717 RepID=A0AAX6MMM3_9PEZI
MAFDYMSTRNITAARSALIYRNENRSGLIFMTSFFCCVVTATVFLRFHAKRLARVGISIDDWLALAALILVLALNGVFIGGAFEGAIGGHSIIKGTLPEPSDLENTAQKYKYIFQVIEKPAFGLIKLSLIFLWKRLFKPAKYFSAVCWVMIVITSGWSLSFFFATLFQCGTKWKFNVADVKTFRNECNSSPSMIAAFTGLDLLTDVIIMFMPVPLIWGLRMPTRKKASVTGIFILGLLAENPDFIGNFTLFILWSVIEVNVAIIVCCIPTLTPVLEGYYHSLVVLLSRVRPKKWRLSLLSRDTGESSNISPKAPVISEVSLVPLRNFPHDGASWQDVPRVITKASYGAAEAQMAQNNEGILARTEISRTFEPREGWS